MINTVSNETNNNALNTGLVNVLMTYPSIQDSDRNNAISRKVINDIDDLKVGNIAYIALAKKPKEGDIVLCGVPETTERLEMFSDQKDIIGTVVGHYISGRFV